MVEMLSNIAVQEYEANLKRFALYGLISERQLSEVLSFHHFRTRDNTLMLSIVFNPFFQANSKDLQRATMLMGADEAEEDEKGADAEEIKEDDQVNQSQLTLGNAEVQADKSVIDQQQVDIEVDLSVYNRMQR